MEINKYQPSNGTEGCYFMDRFCHQCAHEKFTHTGEDKDRACDIMNRAILLDIKDEDYPKEWRYDVNGVPICASHKPHKWLDENDELIEPENYESVQENDPNQLELF